jgi:hypothetical protein
MKKRNIVLLIIAGIILVIVGSMIFTMLTDEGKAAFWEEMLQGTWLEKGVGDNYNTVSFSDNSVVFSENGEEVINGFFTVVNKGLMEIYRDNKKLEFFFSVKSDILTLEMKDTVAVFEKISDK